MEKSEHCEIVICPPFTSLPAAVEAAQGSAHSTSARRTSAWAKEGAFTGEISGPMIRAVGATHAIIGHSERRQYFGETDDTVLKRTQAALEFGLTPIVCVGERLEQRETGRTEAVLVEQFGRGIAGSERSAVRQNRDRLRAGVGDRDGKTATPEIAADAHRTIRNAVRAKFGKDAGEAIRILYGGSVKPDNTNTLMAQPEIDGVLVGGASLDAVSFASIVNF